ncbi:MFS transporter [Treponema sp. OMZ 855]|uniref:MFS transporter n=1 Tax=Treponema sp. OMZ 855 TaxID=1643512 RepID=UPI0020A59C6E|nr:MFS transporter [Treponema sp. OMZ 855]UTC51315.1 MFS transporter [Treponema sp. OMZ 855]
MEKSIEQPLILRRGFPYFLLFSLYAIINSYLPIMLRTLGFSTARIGILLGVIEIVGVCAPFFITRQLDKTGRYGFVMCVFGIDIAVLLLPLLHFHSFFSTAICLGIFAIGFKGMVPVLDGFTTKVLGQHSDQYGKIRALGSVGFVGMNLFLQLHPLISGKKPTSIVLSISAGALLFILMLRWVPDLYDFSFACVNEDNDEELQNRWAAEISDGQEPLVVEPSPKDLVKPKAPCSTKPAAFSKQFWECLLLIFLAFLGLVPSQRFFSLYVEEYIKIEASAGLWALSAMAEIPLLIISGKCIRRFGKERLLPLCLFTVIVRNFCYIFIPGIRGAIVGQLLHSLSFGLFYPLSVLLCVLHSCGKTVTAMAFFTAANGIAYVIGSIIGGYIIEYMGYPALFLLFSVFPAIGIACYLLIMRNENTSGNSPKI